jgi:hypothetical protein
VTVSARPSREERHAAEARRRVAASARKPETTRPPKVPDLDRDAIAEAVHQAVCLVGRDQGIGHCDAYAFGGAIVLSVITRQEWHAQGGEARFGTGQDLDSPDGEICFAWQPSATTLAVSPNGMVGGGGLANGELHAWCARAQGGKAVEIADFAARHVPTCAETSGIGWAREPIPYAWGTPQQLHGQRIWYIPDRATTDTIHRLFNGNSHSYSDIAVLALWKLGVHGDRRAEELIHDGKLLNLMRDGYTIAESFAGGFIAVRQ